jgi:hypothetical protein
MHKYRLTTHKYGLDGLQALWMVCRAHTHTVPFVKLYSKSHVSIRNEMYVGEATWCHGMLER